MLVWNVTHDFMYVTWWAYAALIIMGLVNGRGLTIKVNYGVINVCHRGKLLWVWLSWLVNCWGRGYPPLVPCSCQLVSTSLMFCSAIFSISSRLHMNSENISELRRFLSFTSLSRDRRLSSANRCWKSGKRSQGLKHSGNIFTLSI